MTAENTTELIIAVAEARGWTEIIPPVNPTQRHWGYSPPSIMHAQGKGRYGPIPDYLTPNEYMPLLEEIRDMPGVFSVIVESGKDKGGPWNTVNVVLHGNSGGDSRLNIWNDDPSLAHAVLHAYLAYKQHQPDAGGKD